MAGKVNDSVVVFDSARRRYGPSEYTIEDLLGGADRPDDGGSDVSVGGGGFTFPLDIAPTTPHEADDEFTAPTLDPKWTPGSRAVTTILDPSVLTLKPANHTNSKSATLSQVAPGGTFEISAKISSIGGPGNGSSSDVRVGLYLGAPSIPRALVSGIGLSTGPKQAMAIEVDNYSETADWGAFNGTWSGNIGQNYDGSFIWHRMVWDGSNIKSYFSPNGVRWNQFYSRPFSSPPTVMGLALYANSTGGMDPIDEMSVDWFRCKTVSL